MRIFIAILLILIGIAGVFLPLLPGVPFLIVAGFLLGIVPNRYALRILKSLRNKKNKNTLINKLINYIIMRYIHNRHIDIKVKSSK